MARFRLKLHTGPLSSKTLVELSRKLKKAGVNVQSTGTEGIWVDVSADDCSHAGIVVQDKLKAKFGKPMGWARPSSCQRRKR